MSKYTKHFLILACISLGLISCSTSQTSRKVLNQSSSCALQPLSNRQPASYHEGPINNQGRWLVDKKGRVVILHGVNVVSKDFPFYPCAFGFSQSDSTWLSTNGLDIVRLGVLPSGEMPTKGKISQQYIANLLATINTLSNDHIFIVFDWHQDDYGTFFDDPNTSYRADGMPTWMTITDNKPNKQSNFPFDYVSDPALMQAFQSFWDDSKVPNGLGLQEYYVQMLQAVAQKVANNPWILGYEIMNEPWPGNDWSLCVNGTGCPTLDKTELDPFYKKAAYAIRAIDKSHMIFMEPFSLFNFGAATSITAPPGVSHIGLAFHQYAQSSNGAETVFSNAIGWSSTTGGALLNTEFSSVGDNPATISGEAQIADNSLMSWTYWLFDNCDIACSTAKGANLILNPFKSPNGSNINGPVTDGVVRPYPILISGTPNNLAYDPSNHVMQFDWSSQKVGASSNFPDGSTTSIVVPKLDFPTGYSVSAIGATITSSKCSPLLTLSQTYVSSNLSVTVSPSNSC